MTTREDIQAHVLVILSDAMGQTLPTGYAARRLTEWFWQELEAVESRVSKALAGPHDVTCAFLFKPNSRCNCWQSVLRGEVTDHG